MTIRTEAPAEIKSIRAVHRAAFARAAEAELVDRLRRETRVISLVADEGGSIVGHILFSPVTLAGHPDVKVMGLAPVAVAPGHQRQGVGSMLVRRGLEVCRQSGVDAVVLVGHPECPTTSSWQSS